MPKTKSGEQITWKEFMKRWKRGIEGVTALQQTQTMLWSMTPIFIGIIWGIVFAIKTKTWWLALILVGSLPITTVNYINTLQKYWVLKKQEEILKELNVETKL